MKNSIMEINYYYLIIMIFFIFLFYSCCHSPLHSPCPESNWGSNYLCSECKDLAFIMNIGTCEACAKGTSSGAFSLCNSCACKLKECQHCRKILEIYFYSHLLEKKKLNSQFAVSFNSITYYVNSLAYKTILRAIK